MKSTGGRKPSDDLMAKVRSSFETRGFDDLTMRELAEDCGFTRRSLYNYFRSKDEAFRGLIRWENEKAMAAGLEAGRKAREAGGSPVDVFTTILDIRYGTTRRRVNALPHVADLAAEAFRRAGDIMVDAAITFRVELEHILSEFITQGLIELRPGIGVRNLGQLLTDGARGVNQSLPVVAPAELNGRYREMTTAILLGTITMKSPRKRGALSG